MLRNSTNRSVPSPRSCFAQRTRSLVPGREGADTWGVPEEVSAHSTSRYVSTKKWRIHLNEAGDGHPVVLLHGSGPGASGWSNFQTNIGPLAQDFRVLAVDMPGWGDSDTAPPEDRDHVEALVLLLDELELDKVAVVGNSMGGMTALRFAVEHPGRLTHLVPMGAPAPGTRMFSPGGLSEGLKVLLAGYEDPSPARFKRLVEVMAYDQRFATDELAAERSRTATAHPDHLANFLASWRQGVLNGPLAAFGRIGARLGDITVPTLVIHGRDDRTVHYENGLQLVSAIPDSRLLLLNRCGHWAQLEHADEFNRHVAAFVRSAP
jgi:2-hydroxy-6-oxonona-2,4-dienedioate hydrolase